eukprot:CAMPEP_0170329468 /NCGR_PEP_ID=MMETSP0116_2-20130129/65650_1 /TAXON_ID=400756 /ORGANISM="Durinskia baltica, Strain CSIRO CS-38" /LENGTH=31 /DNA_ID= /DNA_START= /DNA_END= /DNA_ORIENTATION=
MAPSSWLNPAMTCVWGLILPSLAKSMVVLLR